MGAVAVLAIAPDTPPRAKSTRKLDFCCSGIVGVWWCSIWAFGWGTGSSQSDVLELLIVVAKHARQNRTSFVLVAASLFGYCTVPPEVGCVCLGWCVWRVGGSWCDVSEFRGIIEEASADHHRTPKIARCPF